MRYAISITLSLLLFFANEADYPFYNAQQASYMNFEPESASLRLLEEDLTEFAPKLEESLSFVA